MKDKKRDYKPMSVDIPYDELIILLNKKKVWKLICFHDWAYWTFGKATKVHRVCKKCYMRHKQIDKIWHNRIVVLSLCLIDKRKCYVRLCL